MRPEFLQGLKTHISGRKLTKSSPSEAQQVAKLQLASRRIINTIDDVVVELNGMPCPVVVPSDLRQLLHKKGIPSSYLGMLYETLQEPYLRKLAMSEIIASSLSAVVKRPLC